MGGSTLDAMESGLGHAGRFARGVGEGAWDGVTSTLGGVVRLVEDGYKLATDGSYREQAWNTAVDDARAAAVFAATAVTDPGEAADEVGNTASHAWQALESAYNQAAAHGQGSDFIGQLFGQGAILAVGVIVPGGAEADGVEGIGDAGRADKLLDAAGASTNAGEAAGGAAAKTAEDAAKSATDIANVPADSAKETRGLEGGETDARGDENSATAIARSKALAFGTGPRIERADAIIDRAAQVLGREDPSSLVDNVVYDPAADSPDFWVDPLSGERTVTLDAATFRKTMVGQLIVGTHELVHAEQWEQALIRHAGNLDAAHMEMFIDQNSLRYVIREIEVERSAVQNVKRYLGSLTPQQVGHSTRYIEGWQRVVWSATGRRVP